MNLLAFAFLALPAFAAQPDPELVKTTIEAQPACENFVRYDDQYTYLGFGKYRRMFEEPRSPIPGLVLVAPLGQPDQRFGLGTLDGAIGAVREGDSLFVLTYTAIEEWSLSTKARVATYDTYMINGTKAYMEHAQAMARAGDKLVIAHGRLGVSFFNLKTRHLSNQFRLVQNQLPLESMATGVSVTGNTAYIVMDNFSLVSNGKPAFRGIIQIDVAHEKVISELDGMDPGADAVVTDGRKAIVSFGGNPVWKYALPALGGRSLPEPEQRLWRFTPNGNPVGQAALDDKYYYTCFLLAPDKPGGRYKTKPLALNRAQMLLD